MMGCSQRPTRGCRHATDAWSSKCTLRGDAAELLSVWMTWGYRFSFLTPLPRGETDAAFPAEPTRMHWHVDRAGQGRCSRSVGVALTRRGSDVLHPLVHRFLN